MIKTKGWKVSLRKVPHKEYETAHSKFEDEIAEPLRNGSIEGVHVTRNPSKACLFIVPGLCNNGNRCDTWEGSIPARLNALPYWNTYGRNHIIFDNEDSELPKYNTLDAMIIRTAFHTSFMRHGFDVQMLLHGNVDLRSSWTHLSSQEFLNRPLKSIAPVAEYHISSLFEAPRSRRENSFEKKSKLDNLSKGKLQ